MVCVVLLFYSKQDLLIPREWLLLIHVKMVICVTITLISTVCFIRYWPAFPCSRATCIAIPQVSASEGKMLGQMLKSWNFSLSVFFSEPG